MRAYYVYDECGVVAYYFDRDMAYEKAREQIIADCDHDERHAFESEEVVITDEDIDTYEYCVGVNEIEIR